MSIKKLTLLELFLWLFIFVLFITFLSPMVLGFKIKNDYPGRLKSLSDTLKVEIKLINYNQGFFSSNIDLTLRIPGYTETVKFKEKVIHGPLYFGLLSQGKSPLVTAVIQGELVGVSSRQPLLKKIFSESDNFVYQAIIGYSNEIDTQYYLPAIRTQLRDKTGSMLFNSASIIINQHFAPESKRFNADINISTLTFKSKIFTLNINAINLSFDGYKGEYGFLIGDSIVAISLLDIYSGIDQFAIRDLVLRSISSEQDTFIHATNHLSVRELLSSNQKFGPLLLNVNIKGFNVNSLSLLRQLHQKSKDNLAKGMPVEQASEILQTQVLTLIPSFLKQVEVDVSPLSISSELGDLQAEFGFKVESLGQDVAEDALSLLAAVNFNLDVSVEPLLMKQLLSWEFEKNLQSIFNFNLNLTKHKLFEAKARHDVDTIESIQEMLDDNWLVNNEQGYSSKITLQNGKLLVNNKLMNPFDKFLSLKSQASVVQ